MLDLSEASIGPHLLPIWVREPVSGVAAVSSGVCSVSVRCGSSSSAVVSGLVTSAVLSPSTDGWMLPLGFRMSAFMSVMASSTTVGGLVANATLWGSLIWLTAWTGDRLHLTHSRYRLSTAPVVATRFYLMAVSASVVVALSAFVATLHYPAE